MTPLTWMVLQAAFWGLLVLVAICLLVVALGPSIVDRVVATDIALVLLAVDLAVFSTLEESPIYMDAALLIAIISFLVTVVVARYLESGEVLR